MAAPARSPARSAASAAAGCSRSASLPKCRDSAAPAAQRSAAAAAGVVRGKLGGLLVAPLRLAGQPRAKLSSASIDRQPVRLRAVLGASPPPSASAPRSSSAT